MSEVEIVRRREAIRKLSRELGSLDVGHLAEVCGARGMFPGRRFATRDDREHEVSIALGELRTADLF